jgi:Zn-dependent peptidase ImmA (M78 family)
MDIPALTEPSVLRWARETVDLTPTAADRKLGVPDGSVLSWEEGRARPTIANIRKAAEVYRRSLAVFFLPEPPTTFDTMRDFRRLVGGLAGVWSEALHEEYRRAHWQREQLLELAQFEGVEPAVAWRQTPPSPDDHALAANGRANLLELASLALPDERGSAYDHLNYWTAALESAGILVMTTTGGGVSSSEMRGFSLHFDVIPVITLNGTDSPRGRLFSLLHEYSHLLLHTAGLCDTTTDRRATDPDRQLEARCNRLAAAMLMPGPEVLRRPGVVARAEARDTWDYPALAAAAEAFGVSAEAFLLRLVSLGRVDMTFYEARRPEFLAAYEADEQRSRPSGGNWYLNTVRDLGRGYVRRVAGAHRAGTITSYTAATMLDVQASQIEGLASRAALPSA